MVTESEVKRKFESRLSKGIFVFSTLWIVRLLAGVAIWIVLYRYFGPEQVGVLAIANAVFGISSLLLLDSDAIVIGRLAKANNESLKRIVAVNYALKGTNKLATAGILILVSNIVDSFYRVDGLRILLLLLAAKQVVSVLSGPVGPEVLQGLRRYRAFFFQYMLITSSQAGALALCIWLQQGLADYIFWWVILDAVVGLYAWYLFAIIRKDSGWRLLPLLRHRFVSEAQSIIRKSIPLSCIIAMNKIGFHLVTLLAGRWFELAVVGHLSLALNVVERAHSGARASLGTSLLPFFSELSEKSVEKINDLYERGYQTIFVVSAIMVINLVWLANEITLILGGIEFFPAVILLQILSLQLIFRSPLQVMHMVYLASEKTLLILKLYTVKNIVEVSLVFLLTSLIAENGIVVALVISHAVYAVCSGWIGFKYLDPVGWKKRYAELGRDLTALLIISTSLIFFWQALEPTLWVKIIVAVLIGILMVIWVYMSRLNGRRTYLPLLEQLTK